jgi:hypothetical protein
MLRTLLISLALLAMAVSLAVGGGLRGMSDGGLRFSADIVAGFGDGGLSDDESSAGMGDGGLRSMGDGGLY